MLHLNNDCLGNPTPIVHWFRGLSIIDDSYSEVYTGKSINTLQYPLKRDDLMMILTCKASNNNLTEPITQSIAIDLNRKK